MMLTPTGCPPPQHSSRHGPQHTQHTASTAATPHYPQGRRQTPADAPTPLKRSMLTPLGLRVNPNNPPQRAGFRVNSNFNSGLTRGLTLTLAHHLHRERAQPDDR